MANLVQNKYNNCYYRTIMQGEEIKMKINLTTFFDMNCLEETIANYALACQRDYQMMFAQSWRFSYVNNSSKKIGERISCNTTIDLEYLKKYHGIEIIPLYAENSEDLIMSICNHVNNKIPTIIFISNYYFPWNEHYHKFDNGLPHAVLITDMDIHQGIFYCCDPKFMQERGEILFQDIIDGASTKHWILKCLNHYTNEIPTQKVLAYSLTEFTNNKGIITKYQPIDDIYLFSEQIKYNFDIKSELDGTHGGIWIEPIVFNISNIIAGRCNYERMLLYIIDHNNDHTLDSSLLTAKENLSLIITHWRQVRGLIVKSKYINTVGDLYLRISNRIKMIADLEFKTVNILLNPNHNKNQLNYSSGSSTRDNEILYKNFRNISFIPLEHLFNYQRFFNANDPQSLKSVGGLKYFFHIDSSLKKQIWEYKTLKFFHPIINGYAPDSIACSGENIQVDHKVYDVIMFMLHGELNVREDKLIVHYYDNTDEELPLVIPHSSSGKHIIWTGQWGYTTNLTETYSGNIYAIYMKLKKKALQSISLPNCPNIIIFAISLATY